MNDCPAPRLLAAVTPTRAPTLLAGVLATLCVACSSNSVVPLPSRIDVALAPAASPGTWVAEFTSARPVRMIRLKRNPDDSRQETWHLDPAFEMTRRDGADVIQRR